LPDVFFIKMEIPEFLMHYHRESLDCGRDGGTMRENSKTAANLKGQLSKYSGIISNGFNKAKRKLIKEMLYGIQAAKDVKLSNIARTPVISGRNMPKRWSFWARYMTAASMK
jgi:hypothetical protein